MRLKRLLCKGFKSFADRTELEFDNSLTGIVGPNGCGKSNVVDALKWVLGDQRARSLRGIEMTDVIFKGAQGREAMQVAEVSVTLEDEEGRLGGRTEVTIGRRLNRDKESDYLLNGEPVRLKDVRDLLMDTGLGVGAYSVMEQGRIDALLSANPEDRRAIFEEAAGISRFKLQKKETLRRLERTEQNLARVTDLLEERQRRIRSLKIQAGKARRYRELKDALRDLRTALAVLEAQRVRADRAELEAQIAAGEARAVELEAQRAELAGRLDTLEVEIEAARARHEEVQERQRRTLSQEEAARHRSETHSARAREMVEQAEQALARREALRDQQQERTAQLEDGRARLVALEDEIVELGRALESQRVVLRQRQEASRAITEAREAARTELLECIHARTAQRNQAHGHEAQIRATDQRTQRVTERRAAAGAELAALEQQRAELQAALDELGGRATGLRGDEARVLDAIATLDREAGALARREAELREALSEVSGRLRVLRDMESRMEGLDAGPRHVLQTQPAGLRGSLLDLLRVDLDLGPAMEAALGPFTQALVVDTREHADAIVAELQAGGHGRAILLVESEFGVELDDRAHPPLPAGATLLADRLQCEPSARRLVNWLLRGVCIVGGLDQADPRRPDLAFVTTQGALLCGPRIEGGSAGGTDAQRGLVVRRTQIAALEEETTALQTQLDAIEVDRTRVRGQAADLDAEARTVATALEEVRGREQDARAALGRLAGRDDELRRSAEALALEAEDLSRQRLAAVVALGDDLLRGVLIQRRERIASAREQAVVAELAAAQAETATVQQAEHDLRVRQASAASDRDGLRQKLRVQEEALEDLARASSDMEAQAAQARQGAEESAAEAVTEGERAAELRAVADAIAVERDATSVAVETARTALAEARDAAQRLDHERQRALDAVAAQRLGRSEADHRFLRLEERLRDDVGVELRRALGEVRGYGIETHEGCLPTPPFDVETIAGPPLPASQVAPERSLRRLWLEESFDAQETGKEVAGLQAQIDRLGAVNMDAVRELEEEEGGIQFLENEVKDLKDARKSLVETLTRLEEESKRLFETNFEAARANFQTIFRKLFQGGRADMYLVQAEDSLEAGIEIMAKPPGKELQSINLLSGGERSLTALAILFAVFKVKPSPFCILDEVDAALDDTNVERFLRVLREFVGPTQFCVVTHHKRTMAACQVLYGITMQKKGISSRIAVSLHEVDSLIQPADVPDESGRAIPSAERQRIAGEEAIGFET